MRRLLLAFILTFATTALFAQHATTTSNPATDTTGATAAHGAASEAHEAVHGEEGGEKHEEKRYFWNTTPGWVLKLANMLLFFGILWKLLKGPVAKAFRERSEQIRRDAEEAKERRVKADQMASDIQARLTQIEADVRSIHERAQAEGERQKRELIAAAEAEAQKILSAARSEVDNRLKNARKELTEFAGQLATERAEAILKETITEQDQRKLFEDSLRELSEVKA